MSVKRAIDVTEKTFLVVIALFTVVAMLQEIALVIENRRVELKDLLLMFIYAEVLGMLGAFYSSHRIPITIPLFIAMTALSRCIDPAEPAQLIPLKHTPRLGFSCQEPDAGAFGCRN